MYKLFLLKVKHWQLFILFYGLPLFYQIVLIGGLVSNTIEKNKPDIATVLEYSKYSSLIIMIPILLLLCWFWSVGVGLNNKLSRGLKLQTGKFKVFIIFIAVYFITISICIWIFMNSWGSDVNFYKYLGDRTIFFIIGLFILLSIFIIFCLFYSFYFVAKTFKIAELEEKVNFSDYAGEFLLIWLLFPIGIWFIQPRINKLVS